ncbi:MAG: hypothetical protein SFV15_20240, partial [Polyangiaceae bacterium]|nr:hypothetical protein [Polyangiaceae bacterium]
HSCLKREADDAPFFTPNTTNTLAYNQYLRNPNGSLIIDAENREVTGAWYRIRSRTASACREVSATRQIGCLAAKYTCSMGFARQEAEQLGATAVWINSAGPTPANVLSKVYPLASPMYLNSLRGFENGNQEVARCFAHGPTVHAAAAWAGLLPLNLIDPAAKVRCVDFNESTCEETQPNNFDACLNNPLGIPPYN